MIFDAHYASISRHHFPWSLDDKYFRFRTILPFGQMTGRRR